MHRCTKIDKYDVLSINVCHCEPTSMDEGGGVDKGSSVVDERCVRAGNSLVLHVSVVLMGEAR